MPSSIMERACLRARSLLTVTTGMLAVMLGGCSQLPDGPAGNPDDPSGAAVRMNFRRQADFYEAPFPSDELRRDDGTIDPDRLSQFPNPKQVDIISQAMALIIQDARGFAVSGAVYFSLTQDLGAVKLPDAAASTTASASVFLMDLERKTRHPVLIRYVADGGPFGGPNLLSLLPVQGIPLRPGKTYVAVVRRTLVDEQGHAVHPAPAIEQLAAGVQPEGLSNSAFASYKDALKVLADTGITVSDLAGLAVFTTGTPAATMGTFRQDVLSRPLPAPLTPFVAGEIFPDYCVFNSSLDMPDYQQGEPPYSKTGGGWSVDAMGKPVGAHNQRSRLVVTIPRTTMPAGGYPTMVMIRTGGEGDRPLVDRGVQAVDGGPPIVPGSGPAREFARVGFAGVQVDGPLGGPRNVTGGDEQFLIFNVFNPTALRDNVRESALELILLAHILPTLSIAARDCPGVGATVTLDQTKLGLMGHSMGATIAPLVLAWEPLYRVAILSGAGGSYIENIMWKRKPTHVRPLAETLLRYPPDLQLSENEPALTIAQWAAEPSDPPIYAHMIVREPAAGAPPRHVLMQQGIVDNYILPNIANATSLSLGLDLGGPELDRNHPELSMQTPVLDVLPLVGRGQVALPASGNVSVGTAKATAILVQHHQDALEDGHKVVYQLEAPKHQYRCFIASFAAGKTPIVPPDDTVDAPCP